MNRREIIIKAVDRLRQEIIYYKKEIYNDDKRIKDLKNLLPDEDAQYKIENYTKVMQENELAMENCIIKEKELIFELEEINRLNKEEEAADLQGL
ncbi:hypothetical protein GVAV_002168 [Gurleya vavrai]